MIKIPESLSAKLKSPKVLMIAGFVGIMLIFISTLFGGGEEKKKTTV